MAATLHELGQLSGEAGDLPAAKQHSEDPEPWKKTAKFQCCGPVVYSVWSLFLLQGLRLKITLNKIPQDSEQGNVVVYCILR